MYRWEGPDYESLDTFILDSQYPIQNLCIDIIKSILNTNTVNIILTEEQFKKLHSQYSKYLPIDKNNTISPSEISESLLAYWKFKKLGYDVKLYK